MHLNEIKERIDNYGPYKWIDPDTVLGIDNSRTLKINKNRWLQPELNTDDEGDDEIIVDYLWDCLMEQKRLVEKRMLLPSELNIDAIKLVKAAVYLIGKMGSSYAATHLSMFRELLTGENVNICIDITKNHMRKPPPSQKKF